MQKLWLTVSTQTLRLETFFYESNKYTNVCQVALSKEYSIPLNIKKWLISMYRRLIKRGERYGEWKTILKYNEQQNGSLNSSTPWGPLGPASALPGTSLTQKQDSGMRFISTWRNILFYDRIVYLLKIILYSFRVGPTKVTIWVESVWGPEETENEMYKK